MTRPVEKFTTRSIEFIVVVVVSLGCSLTRTPPSFYQWPCTSGTAIPQKFFRLKIASKTLGILLLSKTSCSRHIYDQVKWMCGGNTWYYLYLLFYSHVIVFFFRQFHLPLMPQRHETISKFFWPNWKFLLHIERFSRFHLFKKLLCVEKNHPPVYCISSKKLLCSIIPT